MNSAGIWARTNAVVASCVVFVFVAAVGAAGVPVSVGLASVIAVLVVELLNSGIEAVTDRISLEDHALAKRAKDLGSAAVLLSLINVVIVWTLALL